jgi:ankyrin repeat protein
MTQWIRFVAILLQLFIFTTSNAAQPSQQEIESLANAISANDSAATLELLKHNTNLCNSIVWWSRRPLHVAVAKGWDEVVDFLLINGVDPNAEGDTWDTSNSQMTPLEAAIQYNHLDIFKRLLAAGANPNHCSAFHGPALDEAFANHREEMARLLLENGANPFLQDLSYWKRTPVEMAITQSDGKLVSKMLNTARLKKQEKAAFLAAHGSTLLEAAVQRGELDAVEALLAAGVATTENSQGLSLLQTLSRAFAETKKSKDFNVGRWAKIHELLQKTGCKDDAFSATGFGDLEAARNFFKANPKVTQAKDNEGQSLLHWSVPTDQLPLTDFWLESGASPAATNSAGQTPLHLAAASGLTNQLARLLAANAPTDVKDTNGLTPLDAAVQAKQTEAVHLLLAKNPQSISAKYGISTPLHKAAADGDINSLTNALQTMTNLETHDELGFTPFQIAVKHGHLLAASLLLEAGADVNARDAKGNTTLQLILQEQPPYISDRPSLRWYARVHQDEQLKYLYPYMVDSGYSSSSALLEATVFLLAYKADISGTNDAGKSVIELATSDSAMILPEGREKLLELLGKHGVSSVQNSLSERDAHGDTALHRAARGYDAEDAGRIIAAGADVNATNNLGRTPLHAAVEKIYSRPGPLEELLKAGANVNAQDNEGLTPLHVLATADTSFRKEATRALLEAGANPNARDKHGRTPLLLFLSGKWPWNEAGDCTAALLEAGANPLLTDDQGQTPLHYLAALGQQNPMFFIQKIGDTLVAAKVDVQARDNEGNTPLHITAKTGTKDVFDWLIQHGASLDATNYAGQTPRQLALDSTNQFSPFRFNSDLDIYQAIREGKLESVAAILKSSPELLNKTNQSGETPLRVAAMSNRTNIVEFLAQRGAQWDDVSATIANRAELLHDILARQPSDVTNVVYGGSLLHLAAEHDSATAAERLIAAGADLKVQDTWGLSPLGDALMRHQTNTANLFLKHDATENIFDAVYLDNSEAVTTLLAQNKSLARTTNKARLTLTEIAAATGHDKILKLLLDNGAPLDSENGTTPLHAAAIYNRTNAAALLIRRGAILDAFDKRGLMPLHLAVIQNSAETAALLLQHGLFKRGADPNARTISPSGAPTQPMPMMSRSAMSAGNSALHFAAMNAQINIIELLLQSGASVNATNTAGMTPLDYASRGNFGPSISFWIGRDFTFGPPDLFNPVHSSHPIPTSARQAVIELLEKAGGKHGEKFPQNRMPGMMRDGFF